MVDLQTPLVSLINQSWLGNGLAGMPFVQP